MTGQSLLDMIELVNQELQLQPTETDVTRGLLALNVGQDYFETLAAARKIKGGQTTEITATINTETTSFPTGFLRVDAIHLLNTTGGYVTKELDNLKRTGGHAPTRLSRWIYQAASGSGPLDGYWTNGSNIYWSPKPGITSYCRVYGFQRQSDITASGTFAYDDAVAFPLATFAARIMSIGVGDPVGDIGALASEVFKAVLDALEEFNRDGGQNLRYERSHSE